LTVFASARYPPRMQKFDSYVSTRAVELALV
jgi:hypothetical protein